MSRTLEAPWTVDSSFTDPANGELLFHAIRAKTGFIVATTWAVPNEAAANLISAAPALLAALKRLHCAADNDTVGTGIHCGVLVDALEAIKQAEGR